MNRIRKLNCIVLSVVILLITCFISTTGFTVYAATRGTVNADSLNIRKEATTSSTSLGKIPGGETVQINSEKTGQLINNSDGKSDVWYNITYNGITGWVSSIYINKIPEYVTNQSFEQQIAAFPESYKPYLRDLHTIYPNWRFYPDNINMTFDEAIEYQIPADEYDKYKNHKVVHNSSGKSWVSMGFGAYDWGTGSWKPFDDNWFSASREIVRYYMDPRNYLNSSVIYAFLPQVYNASTQNEAGINNIIKGTFLANGYSDSKDTAYGGSYSKVLMEAAKSSNVSPYVLAGIILQEQGSGNSFMISGKHSGYEGYYNFFNIQTYGDSDAEKAKSGLGYAKTMGWNTRSKSIIGGAAFCADNYLSAGQDTYYYMNFNMKQVGNLWHQYATNIADTYGKAQKLSKSYSGLKDAELDFKIPVYKDMPSTACPKPAENAKLNNYYFDSLSIPGLTPTFSRYTYKYDLRLSGDATIGISVPNKAAYSGPTKFSLKKGDNTVVLTVTSESGYKTDYKISVRADKDCTLNVNYGGGSAPPITSLNGDVNGDGKITVSDMATIRLHLLKKYTITGALFNSADINGDGKITVSDMATIRLHLLGKYTIK